MLHIKVKIEKFFKMTCFTITYWAVICGDLKWKSFFSVTIGGNPGEKLGTKKKTWKHVDFEISMKQI